MGIYIAIIAVIAVVIAVLVMLQLRANKIRNSKKTQKARLKIQNIRREVYAMKFFVTGVNGQLGHDVMNELNKRGHEGVGSDIQDAYCGVADGSAVTTMPYVSLDITDKDAVMKTIMEIKPDAVVHCAAWTAVDMAEDDDKVEAVRRVNAGGTQNIADACKAADCKMLYLSTDYVFDDRVRSPGSRTARTPLPEYR